MTALGPIALDGEEVPAPANGIPWPSRLEQAVRDYLRERASRSRAAQADPTTPDPTEETKR